MPITDRPPASRLPVLCLIVFLWACNGSEKPVAYDTIIRNVEIYDGSGSKPYRGSIAILNDTIAAVGDIDKGTAKQEIDGKGMALAPGFMDTHSHADEGLDKTSDALAVISQGITTVIVGQDGFSHYPLSDFFTSFEKNPAAINVASYAGHGIIRSKVMEKDYKRHATPEEVEKMKAMLRQEMESGALGLSTGLEYDPALYSDKEEIVELAKTVTPYGGRYISHMRSEDRYLWEAVQEIINIGRQAQIPVQISHTKIAMRSFWDKADSLKNILDKARKSGIQITADMYPYAYWQSTLAVLFPERDFDNRKSAEFALKEAVAGPEGLLITKFKPDTACVGKTLAEIAKIRGTDPVTTLINMMKEIQKKQEETSDGENSVVELESVIGTSMDEKDIESLMQWPYMNFCSDGGLDGTHPRGFGSFPRILGHYIRERNVVSLEEGIRKMTSLPAENMGIKKRGYIKPGMYADLVLFDPTTVIDNATPQAPHQLSGGIDKVWVNGRVVFREGKPTGNHPGKIIKRNAE